MSKELSERIAREIQVEVIEPLGVKGKYVSDIVPIISKHLPSQLAAWQPIETLKGYGTFLVWLAEKDRVMGSQAGVARFQPNVTTINGQFSYVMPKILYFAPLPASPVAAEDDTQ